MYDPWIVECRANFRSPPRRLSIAEQAHFFLWPPWWAVGNLDPLLRIYQDQGRLRDRGEVVWGHIVQANSSLFEPGTANCPANAIYGDWLFDDDIESLGQIAKMLYELKGTTPDDAALAYFAKRITNERTRVLEAPVPTDLTGGREVYFTTLMVHRKHLPQGLLSSPFFPLIMNREETDATMILPSRYWPESLIARW